MQSDPKFIHQHDDSVRNTPDVLSGDHSHGRSPNHKHGLSHGHAYSQNISPVLNGVWQRVLWSSLFLGALWLLVLWALH